MKKRVSLVEDLFKSINRSAGIPVNESKGGNLSYLFEADDDEDEDKKKDDEDVDLEDIEDEDDDDLDMEDDEDAGAEDDLDADDDDDLEPGDDAGLEDVGDTDDITDDDMKDADLATDDLDVDFDAKGTSDFETDEFGGDDMDMDVDLGGLDTEGMEEVGTDGMDSTDDLLANEPPAMDTVGDAGLDESSDFTQFVTNQLIDFPVDDVTFAEENGARYVDARFGDKAVTFVLYTGEEGQPLLGMLYDTEAYRIELPSEALCDDGCVRDNFMPIEWIRDNLARLVDTAPTFECYRLKSRKASCNESRTKKKRIRKLSENTESHEISLKAIKNCCAGAENVTKKPIAAPSKAKTNVANDGVKSVKGAKEADLGGGLLKWASKAGGDAVMKVKSGGAEASGGIEVPTKSGGKASL